MSQLNFDARQVDPAQAFDPVPAGWYTVQITASETKPTSKNNGSYLQLEMTILDGQYKGRKLFDRLNLNNENPVAVEIAYRTLSAICHATNVIQVRDSSELHNRPMEAKVSVRPADGNYDASNDVKGYRALGSGANAQQGQPQPGGAPMGNPAMANPMGNPMGNPMNNPANTAMGQGGFTQNQNSGHVAANNQPQGNSQPQGFQPQNFTHPNNVAQPAGNPGYQSTNTMNAQPQVDHSAQNQHYPAQNAGGNFPQQQTNAGAQGFHPGTAPAAAQHVNQQPQGNNQMATGNPVSGPAPSANNPAEIPPWQLNQGQ